MLNPLSFLIGALFTASVVIGFWEAWHDGYRHGSSDAWALVEHVITGR